MSDNTEVPVFNMAEVSDLTAELLQKISVVTNGWVTRRARDGQTTDGALESLVIYSVAHILCNTFSPADILPPESIETLVSSLNKVELTTGPVPDPAPVVKA